MVTALSSEDDPLLESVLGVLLVMVAHLHKFIAVELLLHLQPLHGCDVHFLLPLRVQHITVPLVDFGQDGMVVQFLQIQTVVAEFLVGVVLLLVAQGSEVELDPHFGNDLVVELRSSPDAEFSSRRQYSESFGNISHIPSLQVQFVDGIVSLRGKSCLHPRASSEGVDRLLNPGKLMGRYPRRFPQGLRSGRFINVLISVVKFVLLVSPGVDLLGIIKLLLQSFAIVCQRHVALHHGQTLDVVLDAHLLLVVVGQFVDEIVEVFGEALVLEEFVLVQVAVLQNGVDLIVGGVVSVVRQQAVAGVLVEAAWRELYILRRLARRDSMWVALRTICYFSSPFSIFSICCSSLFSLTFRLSHSSLSSDRRNTSRRNSLRMEPFSTWLRQALKTSFSSGLSSFCLSLLLLVRLRAAEKRQPRFWRLLTTISILLQQMKVETFERPINSSSRSVLSLPAT